MLDDFELNMSMAPRMVAEILKQKEQALNESHCQDGFTCMVCLEQKLSREMVSIVHQDPDHPSQPIDTPGDPHVICNQCLKDIIHRGRNGESPYQKFLCPMCRQPMHRSITERRRAWFPFKQRDIPGFTILTTISVGTSTLLALSGGPLPIILPGITYVLIAPIAIACSLCTET